MGTAYPVWWDVRAERRIAAMSALVSDLLTVTRSFRPTWHTAAFPTSWSVMSNTGSTSATCFQGGINRYMPAGLFGAQRPRAIAELVDTRGIGGVP